MSNMLQNYEAALERLIENKPTNPRLIKSKYKINKATVALEAGRDPSAIKNNNPELGELRGKIKRAEITRRNLNNLPLQKDYKGIVDRKNNEYESLKKLYETQLIQLNSLIVENKKLKDKLKAYEKKENLLSFK